MIHKHAHKVKEDKDEEACKAEALEAERIVSEQPLPVTEKYEVPKNLVSFAVLKHGDGYVLRTSFADGSQEDAYSSVDRLEGIIALLPNKIRYFASLLERPLTTYAQLPPEVSATDKNHIARIKNLAARAGEPEPTVIR